MSIFVKRFGNHSYTIYGEPHSRDKNPTLTTEPLTEEEKSFIRERDRIKKRRKYATERAMSEDYNYFGTLSVNKNYSLATDSALLLTFAKRFLTSQRVRYFVVLQNYEVHSEHKDKYHLHFLSDKPVDLTQWALFVGSDADLNNCYVDTIKTTQYVCVRYILRDIGRIPKGKHCFATNAKNIKSEFFVIDDSSLDLVYTNSRNDYTDFIDEITDELSGVISDTNEFEGNIEKEEKSNLHSFPFAEDYKSPLCSECVLNELILEDTFNYFEEENNLTHYACIHDPEEIRQEHED